MPGRLLPGREPRWFGPNHEAFSILLAITIVTWHSRDVKRSTELGDGERGRYHQFPRCLSGQLPVVSCSSPSYIEFRPIFSQEVHSSKKRDESPLWLDRHKTLGDRVAVDCLEDGMNESPPFLGCGVIPCR